MQFSAFNSFLIIVIAIYFLRKKHVQVQVFPQPRCSSNKATIFIMTRVMCLIVASTAPIPCKDQCSLNVILPCTLASLYCLIKIRFAPEYPRSASGWGLNSGWGLLRVGGSTFDPQFSKVLQYPWRYQQQFAYQFPPEIF